MNVVLGAVATSVELDAESCAKVMVEPKPNITQVNICANFDLQIMKCFLFLS
jgi:hypothetical protein